jgi:exopolysaccharide production protein ExoQ
MRTYAYPHISDCPTGEREAVLSTVATPALYFWIPLVLFGLAMYAAEHRLWYATDSFSEGDIDLVAEVGSSSVLRQLSFIALGSFGALLLVKLTDVRTAADRRLVALLVGLCAWAVLSAAWADDTVLSLKRSVVPVLAAVAALGVAKHWQPRQLCTFTVVLTTFFVMLGVAAECVYGTFLRGSEYRFAGTLHPNIQAIYCAALALASLALFCEARFVRATRGSILWLIPLAVGVALLLLTRSRTATVALLAAMAMFFALEASRLKKLVVAGILAEVVVVFGFLFVDSDSGVKEWTLGILQMGREQDASDMASLTGRLPIWQAVLRDVAESPLVGYGYGGFWTPQRVLEYSYIHDWEFNHAHSVYLETLLNVGAIGLMVGLLLTVGALWSAARAYAATRNPGYRFIAAVLTMAVVAGLADSDFVIVGFAPILALLCVSILVWHGRQTAEE